MRKGEDDLTSAENTLLELLVDLVREYERVAFPMEKTTPAKVLEFLMEQNGAGRQIRRLKAILKGSKSQALALAERFGVSPALFI